MTDTTQNTNGTITRDSQNKRLTTSVWVDVSNLINLVYDELVQNANFDVDPSDYDKLLNKTFWYHRVHEERLVTPLPHWKALTKQVIRERGGVRRMRLNEPALLYELERDDRTVFMGRELLPTVQAEFEHAIASVRCQMPRS